MNSKEVARIYLLNIKNTMDYTYHILKNVIFKNYIAVLKGYQDSKIVIMDKKDHINNSHCTKNEVFH